MAAGARTARSYWPGQPRGEARSQHGLADRLGAARADGGGRGRSSGGRARHRLSPGDAAGRTGSGTRSGTPRSASRASSICAITATAPISRSGRWRAIATSRRGTHRVTRTDFSGNGSGMNICVITGLEAEARIARRAGFATRASGGDASRTREAAEEFLREGAGTLLSFGIAGALAPHLVAGALVVPRAVIEENGTRHDVDPGWRSRLGMGLPRRACAPNGRSSRHERRRRLARAQSRALRRDGGNRDRSRKPYRRARGRARRMRLLRAARDRRSGRACLAAGRASTGSTPRAGRRLGAC